MRVIYYGHSAFMIETAGKSILFDPFLSGNPSAAGIDVESVNPDYMLISHGHNDHIEDAPVIARRSGCSVIAIAEVADWMRKKGAANVHGMNIGGCREFEFGKVKMVQAVHSSTMPDGSSGGVPVGFVVENSEATFYFAGDTAYYSDMSLISRKFKLTVAFLPLGDNYTMGIEDAVDAAKTLKVNRVIGMHFDTFENIRIDHRKAIDSFSLEGIHLDLMKPGETLIIEKWEKSLQ